MDVNEQVAPDPPRLARVDDQFSIRRAEIRADLLKWVVGSVALTLITTTGNWLFQYYTLRAEGEKTNRELKIKERDMQLQYLDKFTQLAIDQDITKRIRLAHYISSTIDDKEFEQLASRWKAYYASLSNACKDRLKAAVNAGRIVDEGMTNEPACTIGGLETLRPGHPADSGICKSESARSAAGGPLGELIACGESGSVGYNAFNRGTIGDARTASIDFAQMKILEIMDLQSLPRDNPQRLFAVGKYFLIPVTLKTAVAKLNLDSQNKFTPQIQEHIFRNYLIAIKRPNIKSYITGASDDIAAAQMALAQEFATVARPDTGRSYYAAVTPMTIAISAEQTAQALKDERVAYQQSLAAGRNPEEAWNGLSPGIGTHARP